jgi:hypothetical protein
LFAVSNLWFTCSVQTIDDGKYGVDIPKGVWHKVEFLVLGLVLFGCKTETKKENTELWGRLRKVKIIYGIVIQHSFKKETRS